MDVVIVESPAKAKTINKYLGEGYTVLASYGHVRDLPAKDGSVRPEGDFAMDWEVDARAGKHIKAIAEALRGADRLWLATDPDREGEAISWHVCQVLGQRKALEGVGIKRVVFNEITRSAILDAFARPRDLDRELIDAYLARRALDYLVGFTLSPVLWRKLPGSRSAGRVQSVALRLICERESEIENFVSREYWTIEGVFAKDTGETLTATLTHLDGRKLEKFDLADESAARAAVAAAEARTYSVAQIERKQVRRHPAPPFVTSTLQQEASRKLGFSASHTMRVAQKLYEGVSIGGETVGLITYMRTDGVQMSAEAIAACRRVIDAEFGSRYVPEKPRLYKTKAKNAQEAHEAIRPTDLTRKPADVAAYLDADQRRLYALIWKRTLASQMESAVLDQVSVDIASDDRQVMFRATGSVVAFDGFLRVYREGRDDPEAEGRAGAAGDDSDRMLPDVARGEALDRLSVTPEQHFTQPPPRFTEASLVKRLEELGIGRPSTYASIISVLQDRKYVRLESKRFIPEDRGRLVNAFLESFFERYVAYGFTAALEEQLDDVSGGRIDWKTVLRDFWRDFSDAVDDIKDLRVKEVLDALDRLLGPHFFRAGESGRDPRACPACGDGRLGLKLGRFGAFIGCSNYPTCRYTRPLVPATADDAPAAGNGNGIRQLGEDPATGLPVSIRNGPYGPYVQLGEAAAAPDGADPASANGAGAAAGPAPGSGGEASSEAAPPDAKPKRKSRAKKPKAPAAPKPKRMSLPRGLDAETLDLDKALALLSLPRTLGTHPENDQTISAGLGRFGPYLKMGDTYVSLKGGDDVLEIGLNRAVDLLAQARPAKAKGKDLGTHPDDDKPVRLMAGRYGPYVEHGKVRATLPAGVDAETLGIDQALTLLAEKQSRSAAKNGRTAKSPAAADIATPAKKPAAPKRAAPAKSVKKPKAATKAESSATKPAPRRKAAGSG
ncbi:MAG: type I DNA topoisomerase [Rhodospirillales bacterium]|nr:type I DNA topoisomerase [Rhodospirillales bacterium]